jgi:hypothetical protein
MKFIMYMTNSGYYGETSCSRYADEVYNFLQSRWNAGFHLKYGGNGYDFLDPSRLDTRFAYPGNSDSENNGTDGIHPPFAGWSETNIDGNGSRNTPSDC